MTLRVIVCANEPKTSVKKKFPVFYVCAICLLHIHNTVHIDVCGVFFWSINAFPHHPFHLLTCPSTRFCASVLADVSVLPLTEHQSPPPQQRVAFYPSLSDPDPVFLRDPAYRLICLHHGTGEVATHQSAVRFWRISARDIGRVEGHS